MFGKGDTMFIRILLLLICLQVTGAQAQHEITVGLWVQATTSFITVQNQMVRCGTGTEDQ